MSSTIAQTLSFHRESVTSALIEGRIPRLQDLQDEVLAAIVGQPGEHRARREIDRLPEGSTLIPGMPVEAFIQIWTGKRELVIAGHEAEELVAENKDVLKD